MDQNLETFQHEPICSCGKCIKNRLTSSNFIKFPYSKKMTSLYSQEYTRKSCSIIPSIYYKCKNSGFDNVYKENLPTGLISSQKFHYKPYKLEIKNNKRENDLVHSIPFYGKSTYNIMYPNWEIVDVGHKSEVESNILDIPIRGFSNYAENYIKFPENYYKTIKHLDFEGKFRNDTTNLHDFKKNPCLSVERYNKNMIEKSSLIPAPFPKSNILSSYGNDYIKLKEPKKCLLNEYNKISRNIIKNS